jgi:hypothetical protein
MFICNHCPYVKAIIDRICRDARANCRLWAIGVAAIMSNDPAEYPEDSFDNMQRVAEGSAFPLSLSAMTPPRTWLADYGAVCTPDFFGFNRDLQLQYRGRLDASGRMPAPSRCPTRAGRGHAPGCRNRSNGPHEQTASMGCSIKWRD